MNYDNRVIQFGSNGHPRFGFQESRGGILIPRMSLLEVIRCQMNVVKDA